MTGRITIFHQACKKARKLLSRTRPGVGRLEISTSRKIEYNGKASRDGLQDVGFYCCDAAVVEGNAIHTQLRARLGYPDVETKSLHALRPGTLS
jgi:hypothetical protein